MLDIIQIFVGIVLAAVMVKASGKARLWASARKATCNAQEDVWSHSDPISTTWTAALFYFSHFMLRFLGWLLLMQIVPMDKSERALLTLLVCGIALFVEGVRRHWFE